MGEKEMPVCPSPPPLPHFSSAQFPFPVCLPAAHAFVRFDGVVAGKREEGGWGEQGQDLYLSLRCRCAVVERGPATCVCLLPISPSAFISHLLHRARCGNGNCFCFLKSRLPQRHARIGSCMKEKAKLYGCSAGSRRKQAWQLKNKKIDSFSSRASGAALFLRWAEIFRIMAPVRNRALSPDSTAFLAERKISGSLLSFLLPLFFLPPPAFPLLLSGRFFRAD